MGRHGHFRRDNRPMVHRSHPIVLHALANSLAQARISAIDSDPMPNNWIAALETFSAEEREVLKHWFDLFQPVGLSQQHGMVTARGAAPINSVRSGVSRSIHRWRALTAGVQAPAAWTQSIADD